MSFYLTWRQMLDIPGLHSLQTIAGVILVPKKILNICPGVKGAAVGLLVGPGQSPGEGHRGKSPQKLLGFRHFRWLRMPLNYTLTRNALLTLLSTLT